MLTHEQTRGLVNYALAEDDVVYIENPHADGDEPTDHEGNGGANDESIDRSS